MKLISLEFKGGILWINKEASILGCLTTDGIEIFTPSPERDKVIRRDTDNHLKSKVWKIIGQSRNLSLPGIPCVEIESDITKFIQPLMEKKSKEDNKIDLNAYGLGLIDAYNLLYNKKYDEKDMRKSWEAGTHFNEEASEKFQLPDDNKWKWDNFIQSLQPKVESIEIEMEDVYDGDDEHDEGGTLFGAIISHEVPVTYEKDGNIYLKIKQ